MPRMFALDWRTQKKKSAEVYLGSVPCCFKDIEFATSGILKTFGNHISDWERTEIRFQNGKPTDIYLSSHGWVLKCHF